MTKLTRLTALVITALSAVAATPAHAEDYDGFAFSLRFPAAITRFSPYADVAAAGNAQAASRWASSNNPASAAWPREGERKYLNSFAPQFTAITFDEGTDLFVTSQALTLDLGECGVILPAAAQIFSNNAATSDGSRFEFDALYFQMQWGKLIHPDWAIGANVNITASETVNSIGDVGRVITESETYNFRFGVVNQMAPKLRGGVIFDYAFAPSRTRLDGPLFAGEQRTGIKDTTHQFLLRPGIAWQYAEGSDFYIDYQAGVFFNDDDTLWVHRFPIGIDHAVIPGILFLRAGTVIDTRGQVSGTTGFGVTLHERASLDFAYQYNMFPEIRSEFGPAQTFTVSVSVTF